MKSGILLWNVLYMITFTFAIRFRKNAATFLEAGFKKQVWMGISEYDFSGVVISARPLLMVENIEDVGRSRVSLEIRPSKGSWRVISEQLQIRGGVYIWIEEGLAPCLVHDIRIWLYGRDGRQESFLFPKAIEAASLTALQSAGYKPHRPKGLHILQYDNSIQLTWLPTPCAEVYDLTYQKVTNGEMFSVQIASTDNPQITLTEGRESCSEYDIKLTSVIGNEYSKDCVKSFTTNPELHVASKLEPILLPATEGITAKWRAYEELPCVEEYVVTICKEGNLCPETQKITRDDSVEDIQISSKLPLDSCSDYSLHIAPLFPGVHLYEKVISFRTLSLPLEQVMSQLSVDKVEVNDQLVKLSWKGVQCAHQYIVFKRTNVVEQWHKIGSTSKNYFQHNTSQCTEHRYGLKIATEIEESEVLELGESIMTYLNIEEKYDVPDLIVQEGHDGVILTWKHRACITNYKIKYCSSEDSGICGEELLIAKHNDENITFTLSNLKPCSSYALRINPVSFDREVEGTSKTFSTHNPTPNHPDIIDASIDTETNRLELGWSKVECAAGYRIHQKLQHSEIETEWTTDNNEELIVRLENPEPCVTYR